MSRCGECKLGCNEEGALYCEENLGYEQCIDRLQDALYAADRPQGEWIDFKSGWKCSACGKWNNEMSNYCPNCGARMKGADDE